MKTENCISLIIAFLLLVLASFCVFDYQMTVNANRDLKRRINEKNLLISACEKKACKDDHLIYWRQDSAFFLKDCVMVKIHSLEELNIKILNGYKQ